MTYATALAAQAPQPTGSLRELTCVLCGSFRRDPVALQLEYDELAALGCRLLSPMDIGFVDDVEGFVFAAHERGREPAEIEAAHLRAMEEADFVWLHAPDGYVGRSAAMELGFAHALGLKVFARTRPEDVAVRGLVQVVASPAAAITVVEAAAGEAPSRSIAALQRYYGRMADARGWADESAEETLNFLRDELEELARALADQPRVGESDEAAFELADIQLYVVHMANVLRLDLGAAVAAKERINEKRFRARRAAA